jgi:hypothetical protein
MLKQLFLVDPKLLHLASLVPLVLPPASTDGLALASRQSFLDLFRNLSDLSLGPDIEFALRRDSHGTDTRQSAEHRIEPIEQRVRFEDVLSLAPGDLAILAQGVTRARCALVGPGYKSDQRQLGLVRTGRELIVRYRMVPPLSFALGHAFGSLDQSHFLGPDDRVGCASRIAIPKRDGLLLKLISPGEEGQKGHHHGELDLGLGLGGECARFTLNQSGLLLVVNGVGCRSDEGRRCLRSLPAWGFLFDLDVDIHVVIDHLRQVITRNHTTAIVFAIVLEPKHLARARLHTLFTPPLWSRPHRR